MIIGIGGVSRAGKSTLAECLKAHYVKAGKTVALFSQDDFVKPTISLPKVEGVPDWERPSTIKWENLANSVEKSKADIKIVEGLFSFYPASLRILYIIKFFVEIDKELFLARKSEDKRWAEEPDWYAEHVWRSYLKYGQTKGPKTEYVILEGKGKFDAKAILAKVGS
ncbi:MAG: nicotinamide/nicotinate riboside kinase [Marinoscillum sp.]|jgi:nicotinamide/nicotinate riboside kinase